MAKENPVSEIPKIAHSVADP
ncbi:hypothetical protein EVA_22160, partial [gut metagenome]